MNLSEADGEKLYSLGKYLFATASPLYGCLDGDFTADQLIAIGTWMKDPAGVAAFGLKAIQ